MKKILTTAALALALGVSTISYAGVSTFGVDTSEINRTGVTDQIKSNSVETAAASKLPLRASFQNRSFGHCLFAVAEAKDDASSEARTDCPTVARKAARTSGRKDRVNLLSCMENTILPEPPSRTS